MLLHTHAVLRVRRVEDRLDRLADEIVGEAGEEDKRTNNGEPACGRCVEVRAVGGGEMRAEQCAPLVEVDVAVVGRRADVVDARDLGHKQLEDLLQNT